MKPYRATEIEAKWKEKWNEISLYKAKPFETKPKFYMLTMLPYPSGDLHIGHWYAMAPSDAIARYKRMEGYNVFFPMGFDAFGLPAENAAIKHNIHPKEWTYKNMDRMRDQLRSMGAMFAWDQEVASCDPEYYKWNQWFFLKFYEHGLAYRDYSPVDFCTTCNTTLAREQVIGEMRLCERCENPVIKKDLNQWKLKITKYSEELLNYEGMEWPDRVKAMQTQWIGKSEGVEFNLQVSCEENLSFRVFTTRPDTVFGMTFCVLAPEHPLTEKITTNERMEAVEEYKKAAARKSEIERTAEGQEKDGVFTGAYAVNPMNQEKIPIWIADYVLASYGTGAIMAVPAHDQRDFDFARKYELPIRVVILSKETSEIIPEDQLAEAYISKENTVMVNSARFDGLEWPTGFDRVAEYFENNKIGERKINYRLHDWLISRQRMWGTPIPFVHCSACGIVPVPYEELPVRLPDDAEFQPTGESPLKYHEGFLKTTCPQCGETAERETDTMDTFFCSSWYYYAYVSPYWKKGQKLTRNDLPWDKNLGDYWLPVDQYTGGIEHATMHLLYFRFFTKAMADMGLIEFREPTKKLFNQGMILGEDHEKMSKSRGNVVNPDSIVQQFGVDAVRIYLMFIGPWDGGGPWNSKGIEGIIRFLKDVWNIASTESVQSNTTDFDDSDSLRKSTHQTLKKVTGDYNQFKFNTAIASLMAFRNLLKDIPENQYLSSSWNEAVDCLILMLAPIAPFISEELWHQRHEGDSVHLQHWPQFNEELSRESMLMLVVQVNGKLRDKFEISADLDESEIKQKALSSPKIQSYLVEKTVRKVIVVKNKLVNIVIR
ncbi:MAG: leucine--tRNA ligase [SAR324 cluster bacterium]|nr:leucine--tRNA ligase [SAR324 cluster bacterium]